MNEDIDRRSTAKSMELPGQWNVIAYPKEEGVNFVIECNGLVHRKFSYDSNTDEYNSFGDSWPCDKKEHNF